MFHDFLNHAGGWSRPTINPHELNTKTGLLKQAFFRCVEIGMILANCEVLGTPTSVTDGTIMKEVIFPSIIEETLNIDIIVQDDPPSKKKKKPVNIYRALNYSKMFHKELANSIRSDLDSAPNLTTYDRVPFVWRTIHKHRSTAEIRNMECGVSHPGALSDSRRNNNDEDGETHPPTSGGGGGGGGSSSSSGGGNLYLDNNECDWKVAINLIRIPSSVAPNKSSYILVITPKDPNLDAVQLIKYLTQTFRSEQDKYSDPKTASKFVGINAQKSQTASRHSFNGDLIGGMPQSSGIGMDRPQFTQPGMNIGSYFAENVLDIENRLPVKTQSVTEDPRFLLEGILEYRLFIDGIKNRRLTSLYDGGQGTVDLNLGEGINNGGTTNDHMDTMKQKEKNLKHQINQFLQSNTDSYIYSESPLNPHTLFTFEHALASLEHLERSHAFEMKQKSGQNTSVNNLSLRHDIESKINYTDKSRFKFTFILDPATRIKVFTSITPETTTSSSTTQNLDKNVEIFQYSPENFYWCKYDIPTNSQMGLYQQLFPWAKSVYTIPSDLAQYVDERLNKKNTKPITRAMDDDLFFFANFTDSSTTPSTTNVSRLSDYKTKRFTMVPFKPETPKISFLENCDLPVGENCILINGAALKTRFQFMEEAKPSNTSFLDNLPKYNGSYSFAEVALGSVFSDEDLSPGSALMKSQHQNGNYSMLVEDRNFIKYTSDQITRTQSQIDDLNEYSKYYWTYCVEATQHYTDTFINHTAVSSYALPEATKYVITYHVDCMEKPERQTRITPSSFVTLRLGATSMLPHEDLLSGYISSLLGHYAIHLDVEGTRKLKAKLMMHIAAIVGHTDMSVPMKLHIFLMGLASIGKSFLLETLQVMLIPGVARPFSDITANGFMSGGDQSGGVTIIQETTKALFDKQEKENEIQLYKTMFSDGNFCKIYCDFAGTKANRERIQVRNISFLRGSVFGAFNRPKSELNATIAPRTLLTTIGENATPEEPSKKTKTAEGGSKISMKQVVITADVLTHFKKIILNDCSDEGLSRINHDTDMINDIIDTLPDRDEDQQAMRRDNSNSSSSSSSASSSQMSKEEINKDIAYTDETLHDMLKKRKNDPMSKSRNKKKSALQELAAAKFIHHTRFESVIAFHAHAAYLEKRLPISLHAFWFLFTRIMEALKNECPFIEIDNRTLIKAERYAVYLTLIKASREEFMSPIDSWTGTINPKYDVPWQPTFVLDMAPRLFATASVAAHALTLISEELINPWHHEVLSYCYSSATAYTQFVAGLGKYEINDPSSPLNYSKEVETIRSDADNRQFYIENGLKIPRQILLPSEGSSGSLFEGAMFPELRDNSKKADIINMNYIVLDSKVSSNASLYEVLDRYVAKIKGFMNSSKEILKGIFVKLAETSTLVHTFEPILSDTVRSVQMDSDEGADKGFLMVKRSNVRKRVDNLIIQPITLPNSQSATENVQQYQLWLSVHVFQQAQKEGLIKDVIIKVLNELPGRHMRASLSIPMDVDISPPPLETFSYGYVNREDRYMKGTVHSSKSTKSQQHSKKNKEGDGGTNEEAQILNEEDEDLHDDVDLINNYARDASELQKTIDKWISKENSSTTTNNASQTIVGMDIDQGDNSLHQSPSSRETTTTTEDLQRNQQEEETTETDRIILKSYLEKIKNDLPSKNVDIVLDIDEWAAYQHIMNSRCHQIRLDKTTGLLMYEHKRMPINVMDPQVATWSPVFSLAPFHVARGLHYHMWNTKNNSVGRIWKSTVIQKLVKKRITKQISPSGVPVYRCDLGIIPEYMIMEIKNEITRQRGILELAKQRNALDKSANANGNNKDHGRGGQKRTREGLSKVTFKQ
jgi:hypothetical protein